MTIESINQRVVVARLDGTFTPPGYVIKIDATTHQHGPGGIIAHMAIYLTAEQARALYADLGGHVHDLP